MRGALVRLRLGSNMQGLWDNENLLVDLQSRIRGDWARQIALYRLDMRRFAVNLQSSCRGFIVRSRQHHREQWWKSRESEVMHLQNLFRAKEARDQVKGLKGSLRREREGISNFQAAIRGALQRKRVDEQAQETKGNEQTVQQLQAILRGSLLRQGIQNDRDVLDRQSKIMVRLQSHLRGTLERRQQARLQGVLMVNEEVWIDLQAASRGIICRYQQAQLIRQLGAYRQPISRIQAFARGWEVRREVMATKEALEATTSSITQSQAAIRGMQSRSRRVTLTKALNSHSNQIIQLQAFYRGASLRQDKDLLRTRLLSNVRNIVILQGLSRAMLLRNDVGALLCEIEAEEDAIVEVQAHAIGMLVRRRFMEKQRFFKQNMEKVVKIQSFIRGRQQGEAYKSLTSGKNPPVGTIKGFVHLLNDSDFDFDEEVEFERLRKTVVQHVRQNEMAEQYIDQLDIKIALLVKNKITLDEVVKHQRHFGGHVGSLLTNTEMSSKDPFDLKALNKNSRKKLEHYQQFFFVLQTQPQYLARLFQRIRIQGTAEKECKKIETLMMGLFGYAQKRREEYYLLKLMARSIKEEIDGCSSIQDYLRGNFFWSKLFTGYIRSPRDRKYLRDLLGALVKENTLENPELDLESDPMQIYRSSINNEELRTGRQSHRQHDIAREEAIKDPETRETFIHHLQDLRDIADQFLASLEELIFKMPYGVRYLAQQTYQSLCSHFPHENPAHLLQIVGHWVWKSYLQPALLQPETWGVVDRALAPLQKRNLGEVSKVLGQVAVGRLFGGENVYLQPLNSYVTESIENLGRIWVDGKLDLLKREIDPNK
jgi:Ras GTPase-activating-like protein IQGAP2/3